MYKKILVFGVIVLMFMALLPAFVKPNRALAEAENEIEIASVEDLVAMLDNTAASYKLIADLDFSEISKTYAPINFCGTLDGNGHSLNNLNLTSENSAGLFLSVKDATISNLVINNFQVYSSDKAGALAAIVENSTLSNVKINLGTSYIDGAEGAGKLAAVIKNCKFVDVVVSGGFVNGEETNEIAGFIENTTQETTKTEENKPDLETPDNKDDENKTPTDPDDGDNKNEIGDNKETGGDDNGDVKSPVGEGGDEGSFNIPTPPETGEPNVPTQNIPAADTEVNGIVSIDVSNSQIVVNEVSAAKIIIICVLAVAFFAYGFIETPLKNWLKKYLPKRKTKNK